MQSESGQAVSNGSNVACIAFIAETRHLLRLGGGTRPVPWFLL